MKRIIIFLISFFCAASIFVHAQKPVIQHVDKHSGPIGKLITIAGSGFNTDKDLNIVLFGAAKSKVVSASETLLEVRVPAGATYAPISVTNLNSGLVGYSRYPFLISFQGGDFDASAFEHVNPYPTQYEPYDVCLCDLDLDGKSEIITANKDAGSLDILSNHSNIGEIMFESTTQVVNINTVNLTCGDLNGDGYPEIVVSMADGSMDRILVLKNASQSGAISFTNQPPIIVEGEGTRRVAIKDLDLDGKPDIVVSKFVTSAINIIKNTSSNGNLSFDQQPAIQLEDNSVSGDLKTSGLDVADLNGDHRPEIIISAFTNPNVYILPNRSLQGEIKFGELKTLGVSGALINIKTADINLDGKLDIIATKIQTNEIAILLNNTVAASTNYGEISFQGEIERSVAVRPWGIAVGDLNGDSRPDVAITSVDFDNPVLTILENTTVANQFSLNTIFVDMPATVRNIKIGDIDGDAKPDIITHGVESDDQVYILRNKHCVQPKIYPQNDLIICQGSLLDLRATPAPGAQYQWYRNDGNLTSSIGTNDRTIKDQLVPGSYEYRVILAGEEGACVTNSDIVQVTMVNSEEYLTPPTIIPIDAACAGEDISLSLLQSDIIAEATYTWLLPNGTRMTGTDIVIEQADITNSGKYIVSVGDGNCFSKYDTALIEVIQPPDVDIISRDPLIFCEGYSARLNTQPDPSFSYQWLENGTPVQGANSDEYDVFRSGSYALEVSYHGCKTQSQELFLIAAAPPAVDFTIPSDGCAGEVINFMNNSTVEPGIAVFYTWDNGKGEIANEINPTVIYEQAGNYNVELTVSYKDGRCTSSMTKPITIGELPPLSITVDGSEDICEGESVVLSVDGNFENVEWNTDETTTSITVSESGVYIVKISNTQGCQGNAQVEIAVHPKPNVTITPAEISLLEGENTVLTASGAIQYEWLTGDNISNPYSENPTVAPLETMVYTVRGINEYDCFNTAEAVVNVVPFVEQVNLETQPLLSPNGDGNNDLWMIDKIEDHPEYTVSIFNRSGVILYETDHYYGREWDGSFKGQEIVNGVYYFVISDKDTKVKTGTITILK